VLAAVVASAICGPRWAFEGFLPRSGRARRDRVARIAADERATVIYEAPGRIGATLRDLVAAVGPERPAAVCRELTKVHEQVARGTLAWLVAAVADGTIPARGELVIVVGPRVGTEQVAVTDADVAGARARIDRLVGAGLRRREAARLVAEDTGIARRRLYGAEPRG
jgi:16S rRNA (cytidine1402-2'-O)-methyltransferase